MALHNTLLSLAALVNLVIGILEFVIFIVRCASVYLDINGSETKTYEGKITFPDLPVTLRSPDGHSCLVGTLERIEEGQCPQGPHISQLLDTPDRDSACYWRSTVL